MKFFLLHIVFYFLLLGNVLSQNDDTLTKKVIDLNEVEIEVEKDNSFGISRLNNIDGTRINAGKKSEAIYLEDLNINLAANNSRQVYSKIPGINVFENDGTGSNIGIGGRGLNPNRISNFNMRQNGYDISADALGYPESYYMPPTEAIERIEVLRGAASLQFGTQFGGMINYKFREAPTNKKISLLTRQTIGSFGFFNSFNQIGGTIKKVSYNFFYNYKTYQGWRDYSAMNSHNAYGSVIYKPTEKLSVKLDYTFYNYLTQQPGGLTDKQFNTNPYLINRTRNWFNVNWNLFSVTTDYKFSESFKMNVLVFGLNAKRDALGFLGRIDRKDDTLSNRNLLSDHYTNFGAEIRFLKRYKINSLFSHFLVGARVYKGLTDRKQGDGDATRKASFSFLNPENLENSAYQFPSQNVAVFIENIFQINSRWNITPGIRYEYINTSSNGYYRLLNKDLAGNVLLDMKVADDRSNARTIFLAGLGTQYRFYGNHELYANFSQNYRSINFNDMRVVNPNFQVDPNLKDEKGYTLDGGIRGVIKNLLYYDVSGFLLMYNNRIGTSLKVDSNTFQIVRYRTNISDSRNAGIEAFAEMDWIKLIKKSAKHKLSTFINTSYINAIYINSNESAFKNKKVEYVPELIIRTGLSYAWSGLKINIQYSYTGLQYTDATNAEFTPSAIYGIVPAYSVVDLGLSYTYKSYMISTGCNNLTDALYFTRRAEGYPGPGILPADPRNLYCTFQYKF